MDSASNWVKGLTGGQLSELGHDLAVYTSRPMVAEVTAWLTPTSCVPPSPRLRIALMPATGVNQWSGLISHANALAAARSRPLRPPSCVTRSRILLLASKSMVRTGWCYWVSWADNGWRNNQFAARYGQGASKFASRLSEDKIGSMAPAAPSELSRAMSSGLNATRDSSNDLTAKERSEMRSDYLAGLATAQDKSARAMDKEKIAVKMNEGAKNSWRSFETMPQATARTKDQQEIADKYNLDDIMSNYNQKLADYRKAARNYRLTGDEAALRQAGYDVIRAAAPG